MNDDNINYKKKADDLFRWYEETKFDGKGNFELVCSFCDYMNALEADDIVYLAELDSDFEDIDDALKAAERLRKIIDDGTSAWLGNPYKTLFNKLDKKED